MSQWHIRTSARFDRSIRRLDRPVAKRILDYLLEIAALEDPRTRGKGLTGELVGLWRYRVGDYRILVEVLDDELVINALAVEHRSRIYDR